MRKPPKSDDKKNKPKNTGANRHTVSMEWDDIFQAIGHPSFILDPKHKIIASNKAISKLTGKPAKYFVGKKCYEIFHAKNKPPCACPMLKLLKSGQFETVEMEMETVGGTFLVSCTPILDESGKLARIIHIATDITERKQIEQKYREGEERFRIILENLPEGVFVHDLDGRIIQVNKAASKRTGYTQNELTSMNVRSIDKGIITRKDREMIWHKLKKGDSFFLVNALHHRKDGSQYPAEVRINSIVLNKKPAILSLTQDVTERKRADERLRDYQTKLKDLAAQLSYAEERERRRIANGLHDNIGQKLAIAKLKLEILKESIQQKDISDVIEGQCGLMKEIIDDTRTLTFELSNPILYEIGLVEAISSFIRTDIIKTGLKCELTSNKNKIELDQNAGIVLFKAVREILINAVKHARAKNVSINIAQKNSDIQITIQDDGVGFDTGRLGPESGKQRGFGLFNIREQLEYMGGRLEIESGPKKGTRIIMTAPVIKTQPRNEKVKIGI